MRFNKNQSLILGIVLLIVVAVMQLYKTSRDSVPEKERPATRSEKPGTKNQEPVKINPRPATPESRGGTEGLNRNPSRMIYTRHAKCRMDCRFVSETEVEQILREGKINYEKSDLRAQPDPRYALEGYSSDGQHLRIIFAPSRRGMVVITCIDLEKEWKCDCK